jgi:anaerobic C4-dicarboxylate transporter
MYLITAGEPTAIFSIDKGVDEVGTYMVNLDGSGSINAGSYEWNYKLLVPSLITLQAQCAMAHFRHHIRRSYIYLKQTGS